MAKQRTYTIQLRPEPEGGFTVRVRKRTVSIAA